MLLSPILVGSRGLWEGSSAWGGRFFLTFILLAMSLPSSEDPEDLRYRGWFPFLSQALWACCVHACGVCWRNNPCTVFGPKEGS